MEDYLCRHWQMMLWIIFLIVCGRYILLAGSAYLIFYKSATSKWKKYKIQQRLPGKNQIDNELLYSLSTICIFSVVGIIIYLLYRTGHTTIYLKISKHGWFYLIGSFVAMIILHDAYFYLTHRLLHTRWFLKNIHIVHHRSTNPTPLAAYCFHPVEAFIESLIVFPFVTIFPVHLTFLILVMNVVGHLGFEFLPRSFRTSSFGRMLTSSTHHNLHHQKANKNFGYYFTWWDKALKTLHKDTYM